MNLGKADRDLVPLLRERLKSSSPYVRECAASLLAGIGPKAVEAAPELLSVLNEPFEEEKPRRASPDEQPDPAHYAVRALSNFPSTPEFIHALVTNLESDVLKRREQAAYHLGKLGPSARTAIPALVAALRAQLKNHENPHPFGTADALGKIAPGTDCCDICVAVLVDALRSKNANMRVQASDALGRFGNKAQVAIVGLKSLTNDAEVADQFNRRVKDAASKALRAIETALVPSDESTR